MAEVFYYDYVTIKPYTYFLTTTQTGLSYVGIKGDEKISPIFSFYPHKLLIREPKRLAPYIDELKEYFKGKRRQFDLPLDISEFGTPFQRSVLAMVRHIPYGTTVSYGDVAAALDNARSVRAVAHAVALDPVLIFIPCHRVILANGKCGSYRLGAREKIRLLHLEKSYLHADS